MDLCYDMLNNLQYQNQLLKKKFNNQMLYFIELLLYIGENGEYSMSIQWYEKSDNRAEISRNEVKFNPLYHQFTISGGLIRYYYEHKTHCRYYWNPEHKYLLVNMDVDTKKGFKLNASTPTSQNRRFYLPAQLIDQFSEYKSITRFRIKASNRQFVVFFDKIIPEAVNLEPDECDWIYMERAWSKRKSKQGSALTVRISSNNFIWFNVAFRAFIPLESKSFDLGFDEVENKLYVIPHSNQEGAYKMDGDQTGKSYIVSVIKYFKLESILNAHYKAKWDNEKQHFIIDLSEKVKK